MLGSFGLAFYKSGDETWTPIGDWRKFKDVIYFRTTGQFYAVHWTGEVFAIDIVGREEPRFTQISPQVSDSDGMFLVEDLSTGDLYQVKRVFVYTSRRPFYNNISGKINFNVFKFDITEGNWIKVDYIGNNIIFFSQNCCMLRSASKCPGCEPNCIYFITDSFNKYFYEPPFD